jgi:hypothetical protein
MRDGSPDKGLFHLGHCFATLLGLLYGPVVGNLRRVVISLQPGSGLG